MQICFLFCTSHRESIRPFPFQQHARSAVPEGKSAIIKICVYSAEKDSGMVVLTRKEIGAKLVFFQLLYVTFFNLIIDYLKLPKAISYLTDLINLFLFFWLLIYKRTLTEIFRMRLQSVLYAALLLLAAAWLTALLNFVPPLLMLWSTRNALRAFPFFFSVILFWNKKYTDLFSKSLILLQIPNTILAVFQFYVSKKQGDFLGGIFGISQGCNGYLCIFLLVVVTLVVERYLHGKENVFVIGATCFSSMFVAALAELKIVYLVVPIIIIASFVLNTPSLKTFVLAALISVALILGVNLILLYFPAWEESFSSIRALINVGKFATDGGYAIPRLGAFSEINKLFFQDSIPKNLFGFGFGACEYSRFDFLTTVFFERYGTMNYRWFSHMMWFLQTGYLGIACYSVFILSVFAWITKMKLRYGDPGGIGSFGQIMCGVMIINFIYNSSLITEAGYLLFASLAIPFVCYKEIIFSKRDAKKQGLSVPAEDSIYEGGTVPAHTGIPDETGMPAPEPQQSTEASPFYMLP